MTNFAKAAYGPNPHAGVNSNADHPSWGGFRWPNGVPAELLATAAGPAGVTIQIRRELKPLVELLLTIAQVRHGRTFERGWTGGYDNRPISGTNTASNHSKGRAFDLDAAFNPYSFTWQSDLPPGFVADAEAIGFYWGGRYAAGTRYDPMHFEWFKGLGEVAPAFGVAQELLGQQVTPLILPVNVVLGADGGWPLPPGHFFGPVTGPAESHSGDPRFDSEFVRNYIAEFQRQLTALGYQPGTADGIWGDNTSTATRAWQARNGFIRSGLCGRNDWDAIHRAGQLGPEAAVIPAFPLPAGFYYGPKDGPNESISGMAGEPQKWIDGLIAAQQRLMIKVPGALPDFGADGEYGFSLNSETHDAAETFQRAVGLFPDGLIGIDTWVALFS